jgi:hypothetical protein
MSVDPLKSHNVGLSPATADKEQAAEDRVELSDTSRSLVDKAGETSGAPPHGTISAERLREVLDRLKANFYDRPEVQDRIARGLSKDPGSQPTE